MKPEQIEAQGTTLVDEQHPEGGLGLRITGLPDGSVAVRARVENYRIEAGQGEAFFVIGPQGTERVLSSLAFWKSDAPKVAVPMPQAAPNDE